MKRIISLSLVITLSCLVCQAEPHRSDNTEFQTNTSTPASRHYIKVALLLDTSNSMDGLIDQAKAQLWGIVNELSYATCRGERPDLQIALYEYGNDHLSERSGFIRKILGFTSDLDDVSEKLFSLTTNGGSEYCGTVIEASLKQLDWGRDADDLKMIFIAGNEPFTQGKIDYRDAAAQAKEHGIVVNTIFCGAYEHGIASKWQEGARLTYGDYLAIDHNQATVHVPSPYDDAILQLNIQLNNTYIPYGAVGAQKYEKQQTQDLNAETYSKANAVSRTVAKGSHIYKNSGWDLVDAEEEAGFSYADIPKKSLPTELRGKSIAEIKQYVAKKRQERKAIQKEIASLNKKRREYLAKQQQTGDTTLEDAMITALKKQAKRKNYTWN